MAGVFISGSVRKWSMVRDGEGHRTFKVTHQVRTDLNDGPFTAFNTPGLPQTGDAWTFDTDTDTWAICTPEVVVKIHTNQPKEQSGRYWEVTNTFTTKPRSRCQDETIEDPLLEPQKVSGNFSKQTKEAFFDKDDAAILSSSHERLFLEVSDSRPTVQIIQNVPLLELEVFTPMVDTVNQNALWDLDPRKIKLTNASWVVRYYGICNVFYTRTFEFEINFRTFDEDLVDMGTTHLKEGGDKDNPDHFEANKDNKDDNIGLRPLDGDGNIAENIAAADTITPKYYPESDFLLLDIPTVLDGTF